MKNQKKNDFGFGWGIGNILKPNGIIANADNKRLKEKLASAEKTVSIWKQRYEAVNEKIYGTQTESPTLSGMH